MPAVRGVSAMGGAEGVVHVKIAQFGQRFGKFRIVRFFFRLEAQILQQGDIAVSHVGDDFLGNVADGVVAERDRMIDQRVQIIRHRPQRIFLD